MAIAHYMGTIAAAPRRFCAAPQSAPRPSQRGAGATTVLLDDVVFLGHRQGLRLAQGGAEAAQPKALPMAEDDDIVE